MSVVDTNVLSRSSIKEGLVISGGGIVVFKQPSAINPLEGRPQCREPPCWGSPVLVRTTLLVWWKEQCKESGYIGLIWGKLRGPFYLQCSLWGQERLCGDCIAISLLPRLSPASSSTLPQVQSPRAPLGSSLHPNLQIRVCFPQTPTCTNVKGSSVLQLMQLYVKLKFYSN